MQKYSKHYNLLPFIGRFFAFALTHWIHSSNRYRLTIVYFLISLHSLFLYTLRICIRKLHFIIVYRTRMQHYQYIHLYSIVYYLYTNPYSIIWEIYWIYRNSQCLSNWKLATKYFSPSTNTLVPYTTHTDTYTKGRKKERTKKMNIFRRNGFKYYCSTVCLTGHITILAFSGHPFPLSFFSLSFHGMVVVGFTKFIFKILILLLFWMEIIRSVTLHGVLIFIFIYREWILCAMWQHWLQW